MANDLAACHGLEPQQRTVVLWDIDKTITCSSSGAVPDLFIGCLNKVLGHDYLGDVPSKDGKTDGQIAHEYLAVAHADDGLYPAFMRELEERSQELFPRVSIGLVDGAVDALAALKDQGVVNGVYTGNTPDRARLKLQSAGLAFDELFDSSVCYCLGYEANRFDALRRVARDQAGSQLVVVGDAMPDLEVAKRLSVPFWHVGSGFEGLYARMIGEAPDFAGESLASFVRAVMTCGDASAQPTSPAV